MATSTVPLPEPEPVAPEQPDPAREANRARFEIELEFVQALASPFYLETLAQRGYFQQEEFVEYLKYLRYWRKRDYARFLAYPQALHHLELLQEDSFRKALSNHNVIVALDNQQYQHWRTWRNNPAMQPLLNVPPHPTTLPKSESTPSKPPTRPAPTASTSDPPPTSS
ncbi:SOH1-domain-containing protein [Dacryopinax primogenitus]|uniref:Mediator of RNA polymerase II transcription subunit 31 n=1 Tax=Dacryopinax primogenitus (strain DJM 731) TaxID=1858805 RepID=M5GFS9_DACPD|nr:SOH1-domain-containing protein [Dacryopinax primogenitus]EJU04398.1 SOH1-domain-containing protein [Dacryopinax primogenitus]